MEEASGDTYRLTPFEKNLEVGGVMYSLHYWYYYCSSILLVAWATTIVTTTTTVPYR